MASVQEHLRRWVEAGLLTADDADRLEAWEAAQVSSPRTESRPGAMEALLYLGVVILSAGVWALLAQGWSELEAWARVLSVAVPFGLMLAAGAALRLSDDPQYRRGSQAAWFVAVPLFTGLLGVIFEEYGPGIDDRGDLMMVIAAATLLLACVLWLLNPGHAQVLALALSAGFLGETMGASPDEYSRRVSGVALLVAGIAGATLADAEWLTPRRSARAFFAVLLILGPFQAGVGGTTGFELLAGAAAAAVVAFGVWREDFALVMVGVAGAFIVLITFIFEHFAKDLGAPLALMLSGAVVIAGVMALAALRGRLRAVAG